jgi:V-type H+-transporting ATPase proteolipid subunit
LICSYRFQLCAGICCGVSGLAAGGCIGIVGDAGVRAVGYRASSISLFPSSAQRSGYSSIPDSDAGGGGAEGGEVSGSEDQNKLFVGMLIMLIFSEALAL